MYCFLSTTHVKITDIKSIYIHTGKNIQLQEITIKLLKIQPQNHKANCPNLVAAINTDWSLSVHTAMQVKAWAYFLATTSFANAVGDWIWTI